mmetsp:Transcript_109649/g.244860  ORF Transcript_109649/g.244860 Transcript_109649/m.244860 type:complete len:462 (+) Transcript_109649:137-1522(+)
MAAAAAPAPPQPRRSAVAWLSLLLLALTIGLQGCGEGGGGHEGPPNLSNFGTPVVVATSATCAAIEFAYKGHDRPYTVYIFAKQPKDLAFIEWGAELPTRWVRKHHHNRKDPKVYRVLVRELPPGSEFQVKVSSGNDINSVDVSPPSKVVKTMKTAIAPDVPSNLQIHRTDPRLNLKQHDGSVCLDLHWSHPHTHLRQDPSDVFFRITREFHGEAPELVCEDKVGSLKHTCGVPLTSVVSEVPSSFATICGLRPKRTMTFHVEAFNGDGVAKSANNGVSKGAVGFATAHIEAVSPPSAPSVVTSLVTEPANQESAAGFRPLALVDWIPQHDDLIEGHAVYLGLREVSSMKMLCWVPHDNTSYSGGHLELPIVHKNHTFSEDVLLVRDYLQRFHVHHEQEILVATRTVGHLESPAYSFRLGEWQVLDQAVKCLTSFDAKFPAYVAHPFVQVWTQAQALSRYD